MSTSTILMSVYHRVTTAELSLCLGSLQSQSRLPDQIVIVIDGPVSAELLTLLERFKQEAPNPVELVPLETNGGLVNALNKGLPHCGSEWVIRMDADDIAPANRLEHQLAALEADTKIDVLGAAMLEFENDPACPERLKPCRLEHRDIVKGLAMRNPINHPTACIRRTLLEKVGGYPELPLLEDYFLWAKLLQAGATFKNLPEPLYWFRFDDGTLERRGGFENFKNEVWLRRWMLKHQLISFPSFCTAALLQVALRLAPLALRRWLWHRSRTTWDTPVEVPPPF